MTTVPFAQRLSCTIPEAAEALGLGRSKLYELMTEGRVESFHIGKRRLLRVESLLRLVEAASPGAPQTAPTAPPPA